MPPLESKRHMICLAFARSFGSESERTSWRLRSTAPASAVAAYTQNDRCNDRTARAADQSIDVEREEDEDGAWH